MQNSIYFNKLETQTNEEHDKYTLPAENYQQVPNVLLNQLADRTLIPQDIGVYAVFLSHRGVKGYAWPSDARIAKLLGCSRSTVQRSVTRLLAAGHIKREGSTHKGTKKTFILTYVGKNSTVVVGAKPKPLEPHEELARQTQIRERIMARTRTGNKLGSLQSNEPTPSGAQTVDSAPTIYEEEPLKYDSSSVDDERIVAIWEDMQEADAAVEDNVPF